MLHRLGGIRWDGDDGPHRGVVAVLIVLGLAMLAHPLFLWPHYGQTPYGLGDVEQVSGETDSEATIAYEELPPKAQAAFDDARNEDDEDLWSGEDERALAALIEYVPWTHETLLRPLLTMIGSFLVAFGALASAGSSWRPVTPRRSLAFVLAGTLGAAGTIAYDSLVSNAYAPGLLPFASLAGLLLGFVGVGSLLRRRG